MALVNVNFDNELTSKIIDLIKKGNYHKGDRLPAERELSAQLGVNRNSLREILRSLQTVGVLDIRQGSGIYVANEELLNQDTMSLWISLNKESIKNVYVVRDALETKAFELIPVKDYPLVAERLGNCLKQFDPADCTVDEFIKYDREFHSIIANASKNDVLVAVYNELSMLVFEERQFRASIKKRRQMSYAEHQAIVAAFSAGNPAFIGQILKAHSESVQEYI